MDDRNGDKQADADGTAVDKDLLKERVVAQLKTVFDPELPMSVCDLGLIYEIRIDDASKAHITMTLTAPGCPAAGVLPRQVEDAARAAEGVTDSSVELTFDPPWDQHMMPEYVKLELGLL
ncbi:MAG: iron-sulfur cluster assembly protein [Candidatus Kapaibacterium sp.]